MTTLVSNQKALEDILSDEEFWREVRQEVLTAVLPLFQELLFGGVEFASAAEVAYKALALKQVSVAGVVADEDRLTTELLDFLPGYTDEWWNSIEQTTRDSMRGAIEASIVAGEPVDKLIPRLETLFSPVRAERIAVTETTRLFNEGAKRTYRAAGVEYVEWSTVMDDVVCSTCMDLQNESRAKPWPINAPAANPPAHVNCRCHLIPVVPAEDEVFVGARANEKVIIKSLRDLPLERAVVVKRGRITHTMKGEETRVEYTPDVDFTGTTHYHNHPGRHAPSDGDIDFLLRKTGPKEMNIITPQGIYTLKKLKEGDFTDEAWRAFNKVRMRRDFVPETALESQETAVQGVAEKTGAFSYSFAPHKE